VSSVVQLNRLIERLCDAGVDFVIVGGFAGMLHGSTLVTRDLDVCAVLSAENIARLRAALGDLQPTHRFTPQRLSFLDTPEQAKQALGRDKDLIAAKELRAIAEKQK
jgi:hypothetical protein